MSAAPTDAGQAPRSDAAAIDPQRHSGPALRTCRRIAVLWDLSADEMAQLIGVPADIDDSSYVARPGALVAMSLVLGIYRSTVELFGDDGGHAWVRTAQVDGQPALAVMKSGRDGLWRVRRLLLARVDAFLGDHVG